MIRRLLRAAGQHKWKKCGHIILLRLWWWSTGHHHTLVINIALWHGLLVSAGQMCFIVLIAWLALNVAYMIYIHWPEIWYIWLPKVYRVVCTSWRALHDNAWNKCRALRYSVIRSDCVYSNAWKMPVKYPVMFSDFNKTRYFFSTDFRKLHKHKISWKSIQWVPSCSMRTVRRTDGQTDMMKLIVAFHVFAICPKKM